MIIIERSYEVTSPRGGGKKFVVDCKAFADDDIQGVQVFLDERNTVSGYEWYNLDFNFIKL